MLIKGSWTRSCRVSPGPPELFPAPRSCSSPRIVLTALVKLNGGRHVQGILRGFDPFMNLVIDECVEMAPGGQQNNIGMVVIRGNSIIMLEALERV
ncbi:small nuclear ribonucleoprotein G isoform X1 [Phalacrocorax carbo]|uniref:small nuclear ribonucleoprotein G isoform X1 n=1 Tax=Phalacrocorax carbo TaxID=9209 RepID=UPI0031195921